MKDKLIGAVGRVMDLRAKVAIGIWNRRIKGEFVILSDDCWGGQIYRFLKREYQTPTIGLWIEPKDYLSYIDGFSQWDHEGMTIDQEGSYPIGYLGGCRIHFLHYKTKEEARIKYLRRLARSRNGKIFYKIDFGKQGYTINDIVRWNDIRLPNSIAIYPPWIQIPQGGIYNGVLVKNWTVDGAVLFNISRSNFDVLNWLESGRVSCGLLYLFLNRLIYHPSFGFRRKRKS